MAIALKHIRFDDVGFKLELGADTGKMDADIFSGEDRMGRYVHIEREEHATMIYREKTAKTGDWELLDIVPNAHIKVSNPVDGQAKQPTDAPDRKPKPVAEETKPAEPAVKVVKLGGGR